MGDGVVAPLGYSVLIVEDEPSLRSILGKGLERYGFRTLVAVDGQEALDVLEAGEKVHLVLSDIVMPRLSGLELQRRLRERHPGLPVVLMTGCVDQPPDDWAEDVPVLRKPFRLPDLVQTISGILMQPASSRASRTSSLRPYRFGGSAAPGAGPPSR